MNWLRRLKFWVSRKDFLDQLASVLEQVYNELDRIRSGEAVPVTLGQLEGVAKELEELQKKAQTGSLPHPEQRQLTSAWYVVDSWPYDYELGWRIVDLESTYRKSL